MPVDQDDRETAFDDPLDHRIADAGEREEEVARLTTLLERDYTVEGPLRRQVAGILGRHGFRVLTSLAPVSGTSSSAPCAS